MTNIDQPLYERIKEWIKSTYNIKSETISPNKETCFFIPKLNPKEAFNWGVMSQKIIDVFHVFDSLLDEKAGLGRKKCIDAFKSQGKQSNRIFF